MTGQRPSWYIGPEHSDEEARAIIARRMREIRAEERPHVTAPAPVRRSNGHRRQSRPAPVRSRGSRRSGARASPDDDPSDLAAAARLPLDPAELAELSAPERGAIYKALSLGALQIASAEDAVRLVIRRRSARPAP